MPQGMTKRSNNTSRVIGNKIVWKIHVVFLINEQFDLNEVLRSDLEQSGEMNIRGSWLTSSIDNIPEDSTLTEIMSKFLDPCGDNSIQRHALRPLRLKRHETRCLMRKLPSPSNSPEFHEVINMYIHGRFIDKRMCYVGPIRIYSER